MGVNAHDSRASQGLAGTAIGTWRGATGAIGGLEQAPNGLGRGGTPPKNLSAPISGPKIPSFPVPYGPLTGGLGGSGWPSRGGVRPERAAEHLLGNQARRRDHPKPVQAGGLERIGDLVGPQGRAVYALRLLEPHRPVPRTGCQRPTRETPRRSTPPSTRTEGDDFGNVDVTPDQSPGSTASSCENVIRHVTVTYAERNPDRGGRRSTDAPLPVPRTGTRRRDRRRTRRPPAAPHRGRHHQHQYI